MSASTPRKILLTSALPYANGPIHLGHMLEHIQTDIWARFQRARGHTCWAVCADDTHGTPVMLRAEREGITPEQLIARMRQEHWQDFQDFQISYDNYYSTHSPENRHFSELIYQRCREQGHIKVRTIRQMFDPEKQLFLADRFIKGSCPKCQASDQYGDNCEVCGATYEPTELGHPVSIFSGATPIEKESEHYFFALSEFSDWLKNWTRSGTLQPAVANKLSEWLDAGLQDWDISRDAPYFGFEIPDAPGKYFYVWLDAPIGYMASFKNLCDQRDDLNFDDFWQANSTAELYHFIGKDIINFHALFWPAMLHDAGFRTPNGVFAHGYVTVNGEKMSKSRGTFIQARTYLEHLDPDYLRYYFAAKLGATVEDIDLNLTDFINRVNSDLVGKVINIASRTAGFITKQTGVLSAQLPHPELYQEFLQASESIAEHYESREYSKAMRLIMSYADRANEYVQQHAPWVLNKDPAQQQQVQAICTQSLNIFRVLMTWLQPVLPLTAAKTQAFLQVSDLAWNSIEQPLLKHAINAFQPMLKRIEPAQIEQLIAASREHNQAEASTQKTTTTPASEPALPTIDFNAFAQVDLRVALVVKAEPVAGADKLLALTLDVGAAQTKTVFSGIKAYYDPDQLVGRHVVYVYNLAPRKMKFGVSEGMVLAAEAPEGVSLLQPDPSLPPGAKIR